MTYVAEEQNSDPVVHPAVEEGVRIGVIHFNHHFIRKLAPGQTFASCLTRINKRAMVPFLLPDELHCFDHGKLRVLVVDDLLIEQQYHMR